MDGSILAMDLGLVATVGGVAALDRRGAFQLMVSQPLVVVPALGLVLGDPQTGLWLGTLLQLLWMSSVLHGANVPPNETVASVSIGAMVLLFGKYVGAPDATVWTLAILLGAPLSLVGRWLEVRLDRANQVLADRADEAARAGEPAALDRLPWLGLGRAFVFNALLVVVAAAVGLGLLAAVHGQIQGAFEVALRTVGRYLLPALGLAVALSIVRRRRGVALAALSFTVVMTAILQGRG